LTAAQNGKWVLRSVQVGPSIGKGVELETQAMLRGKSHGGVPSVQWLPRSGYSIECVGKKSISAVNLIGCGGL
jgi:hypothetical protein